MPSASDSHAPPARALAGMVAAKASPPDGAATDPSTWRWWVDGVLDAQRQVDRVSAQVRSKRSATVESTLSSKNQKTVVA